LLKIQSARNATKTVPLCLSRLPDSGGIFTLSNGHRMEKISRSVRQAKQAKKLMLTVPVRTVHTMTCQVDDVANIHWLAVGESWSDMCSLVENDVRTRGPIRGHHMSLGYWLVD
jgi:hypothetical protein